MRTQSLFLTFLGGCVFGASLMRLAILLKLPDVLITIAQVVLLLILVGLFLRFLLTPLRS